MTKRIFLSSVLSIVMFCIGALVGTQTEIGRTLLIGNQNTFRAGWDAAKKRLDETGFFPASVIRGKDVIGEIQEIKDNKISLKIRPLEPLGDAALDNRIIDIDSATKFYQLTQKDPDAFRKEMEVFSKQQASDKDQNGSFQVSALPTPFTKKEIMINDLRVGQNINAAASDFIQDKKEFVATEIQIMDQSFSQTTIATSSMKLR